MEIPPPLAPWAAQLEIFPTDLIGALGPLVQRLDAAIGPLATRHSSGDGEPNGYDGLSRRGIYERLLISEWLMADEFPEEFVRRAATGEHAFLKLARREPQQARSCVALFDAGPSQLGAPRIAHLAALIVLARRAASAGAKFYWGILQGQGNPLWDEITPSLIDSWLQARNLNDVANDSLAAWREAIGSEIGAEDLWLVGGRRLERLEAARGAAFLGVEDPLEPQANYLKVRITNARRVPQEISLDLPGSNLCARLLRDPFNAAVMPWRHIPGKCAATSNLLFAGPSRLLWRNDENVVQYQIPSSPRAGMGRPKRYPGGERLIASGLYRKSVMAAYITSNGFSIRSLNQQKTPFFPGPYSWEDLALRLDPPSTSPNHLAPLYFVEEGARSHPLMWLPQTKSRCLIRLDGETKKAVLVASQVVEVASVWSHSLLYTVAGGSYCKLYEYMAPNTNRLERQNHALTNFIGWGGGLSKTGWTLAVQRPDKHWTLFADAGEISLTPSQGVAVVGVIGFKDKWPTPGLIGIWEDYRSISIWSRQWSYTLPRVNEPIEHVAVCPVAPRIAYSTRQEVVVYSLAHDAPLLRLRREDAETS